MELCSVNFAWKLGLHSLTLACWTTITSSLRNWMPFQPLRSIWHPSCQLTVAAFDLYVGWTDGTMFT
jgi:hypothetical protein